MKKLYIFGIQRSGTSLLSALLGAHSEINMLFQSTSGDQGKLTGKLYQGNKLCVYHDVRWDKKSNRIRNLLYYKILFILKYFTKYPALRPSALFTVQDLLKEDCKVIIIEREPEIHKERIMKRTGMSEKWSEKELYEGHKILSSIRCSVEDCVVTSLETLRLDPEGELKRMCAYLGLNYESKMLNGVKYQPQNIYNKNEIIRTRRTGQEKTT